MKPIGGEITVRLGGVGRPVVVPATIVGELAVHRRGPNADGPWVVTHVGTACVVTAAAPPTLRVRPNKRALVEWAAAWQVAVPEFFDALRPLGYLHGGLKKETCPEAYALAQDAIDKGRNL